MGWISERGTIISAALGPRRYMVAPVFGVVVAFVDWVVAKLAEAGLGDLIGVPSWAIGLYAATLLVLWWIIEYALKLHKQIKGTRVELSKLRAEGVKLRNDGIKVFQTQADLDKWKGEINDWEQRVIAEIRKINDADAEWFAVLDVVRCPRIPMEQPSLALAATAHNWIADQQHYYQMHDDRLRRLGEMIRELWRD